MLLRSLTRKFDFLFKKCVDYEKNKILLNQTIEQKVNFDQASIQKSSKRKACDSI